MEKGYCRECGKNKRAKKVSQVSHWMHAFLSVLTVGFWVLPWLYIAATSKPKYVCIECGDVLRPIEGKPRIGDDTPFLVKLRGWVVFIVFVTIATNIFPDIGSGEGFGQYLLVLYVILAIYFTLLATIRGRSKGNGEGLEAFVVYTLNNSIFIAFALVTRSLFVTFLGDPNSLLPEIEVSGLGAFRWASIGVPIVGFAISSFMVTALSVEGLFHYETHEFDKKQLVTTIPALIGLFGTVYFFFSFDLIGLQYAWWQFGLISLIPTAITIAASLSEALLRD